MSQDPKGALNALDYCLTNLQELAIHAKNNEQELPDDYKDRVEDVLSILSKLSAEEASADNKRELEEIKATLLKI